MVDEGDGVANTLRILFCGGEWEAGQEGGGTTSLMVWSQAPERRLPQGAQETEVPGPKLPGALSGRPAAGTLTAVAQQLVS